MCLDKDKTPGKGYALSNIIFAFFTLIILIISEVTRLKFFFALTAIGLIGLLLSIFLFLSIRHYKFWINDPWPTKDLQLLKRQTVQAYFISHVTIYFMLGLTIGSLAKSGYTDFFGIIMGDNSVFWSIVILGTLISILPAGALADKWGRKNLVILATYIIVIASIFLGSLELNWTTFTISSIFIGISFSLLHPTLNSSLWIDLASKDSLGRYCGMNGLSLGAGLSLGFLTSYFFISGILPLSYNIIIFLYIGLAVVTLLPLFWTGDSYPPLEFFLLLVINEAGMPIFHYSFGGKKEELKVDLPLISGALSAVNSFMLEATGEKNANLNMVRHGSHFILTEVTRGQHQLTAAIFSNKNDPELQKFLKKFLKRFQDRFYDEIKTWQGNLGVFKDAKIDAEEIFGPLVTISDEDQLTEVVVPHTK
ncbi:MAG: MFS transporter [Candidatus Hodarchaeales archaeon]